MAGYVSRSRSMTSCPGSRFGLGAIHTTRCCMSCEGEQTCLAYL